MFKVIIAGGRDFNDYELLKAKVNNILAGKDNIEIVSGKAPGADTLGERYAKEYNLPIAEFPADWSRYGNHAGPIRNKLMAEYADCLIAFWDGKSRGTKGMIELAKLYKLPTRIIYFSK